MSGLFDFFQIIALVYVFIGLWTGARFITHWRSLWDDQLTEDDARLASRAAFFLLVPPAVILHELGHAALIWAQGLEVADWGFVGYMGWVVPSGPAPTALGEFAIALAGNLVTFGIGIAALALPFKWPGHPVRNILGIELGRQSMFLVLLFYPLICLTFPGDWVRIYDFGATPIASGVVALLHGIVLVVGYGVLWKRVWRPRARLLCSPLATVLVALEKRIKEEPDDLEAHRKLGSILLAAGAPTAARAHLHRVVEGGAADAQTRLAYGTVLTETGRPGEALEHLAVARDRLLRPEDRRAAELMLVRAKIAAGQGASALVDAESLRDEHPGDDRILIVWARAMVAAGQKAAARETIETQLDSAEPDRQQVLRRLFEELR